MTVHTYIQNNWRNTIRTADCAEKTPFKLPKPYTTPCANAQFVNFYYWDTYFTNLGLMLDGMEQQAENNLTVMKFFIDFLGYVPNADHLITRTQPPLFTRAVYDYYQFTGKREVLETYLDAVCKELRFFETDRMTPCGLNAYGNMETNLGKLQYYDAFDDRLGYTKDERRIAPLVLTDGLLAIAESGWDFTPRFRSPGNRFDAGSFAQLDLNCILYDAERKAAELLAIVGREEAARQFRQKAQARKARIDQNMRDGKTGIYYDYNYQTGRLSDVLSAASFCPYALGVSNDAKGAAAVMERLCLPHGISACEYRGEQEVYFQWDYPAMWPSNAYFAYLAMKNTGLDRQAQNVKETYIATVEAVFDKTGALWEKYDATSGAVCMTSEYETPEMMGWTAGVYEYFYHLP